MCEKSRIDFINLCSITIFLYKSHIAWVCSTFNTFRWYSHGSELRSLGMPRERISNLKWSKKAVETMDVER